MDRRQFQIHSALGLLLAKPGLPRLLSNDQESPTSIETWTQWAGPGRDFHFTLPAGTQLEPPEFYWEQPLGKGQAAVVCDGESAISHHLQDEQEIVSRWRLSDGERLWTFRFDIGFHAFNREYDGPHATPVITDRYVVAVSIDGQVHAIDVASGDAIWMKDLKQEFGMRLPQAGYAASPLIVGDHVILPTIGESTKAETESFDPDPQLPSGRTVIPGAVALEIATGRELWRTGTFRSSHASPISVEVEGQSMVVFHSMFELIGVDPRDGAILWRQLLRRAAADNVSFTPIWDARRNQLLICHGYCNFGTQAILLKKENGRWKTSVAWTNSQMQIVHTNAVLSGTTLVGTNRETATLMVGIDVRDGRTLFRKRGFGKSNLLVCGDQLLVLDESGELVAGQLTGNGMRETWRIKVLGDHAWTVPAISGNCLLLRDGSRLKVYGWEP